jgi:hypothetical protein
LQYQHGEQDHDALEGRLTVGLRFQRRIKVFPGVHLNLSRSGVGVSVGGRGAHIGVTARGQRYTSVGLPGTGLSWREYQHKPPAPHRCDLCGPGHVHVYGGLALLLIGAAVLVMGIISR